MDKNKSTFKLKGMPPIYYLNLDGQPERKQYMEDQFKYWEIKNYERISAYDGRDDDLSDIIKGRYPIICHQVSWLYHFSPKSIEALFGDF